MTSNNSPASGYKRLDLLVIEIGLLPNRQIAQSAIMDGAIFVNGQKCTKPGSITASTSIIEITPSWRKARYASRGGLKLERALQVFGVNVSGRVCLDIGASTGGFTDCLLKHGASRVYAVDVGYGQLSWQLRQDSRVIVKERVNARNLTPEILYSTGDPQTVFAVIDVSFISITKVLKPCMQCMNPASSELICLIKPQFEAGRNKVNRGGVVRSAQTHLEVLQLVVSFAQEIGLKCLAATHSPVKGPAGNIEFLVHFSVCDLVAKPVDLESTVQAAHEAFTKGISEA